MKNNKGFTLIELIITITLMSVIFVIIASSLRLSINAWGIGEERIEGSQRVRGAMQLLLREVPSIYLLYYPKDKILKKRYLAFDGRNDYVSFITNTRGLYDDTDTKYSRGMREITYFLDADQRNGLSLKRRERFLNIDDLFGDKDTIETIIFKDISKLSIRYHKSIITNEGNITDGGWSSTFKSAPEEEDNPGETKIRRVFPNAIEFRITINEKIKDKKREVNLPLLTIPIRSGMEMTKEVI